MTSFAATFPDTLTQSEIVALAIEIAAAAGFGEVTKFGLANDENWRKGSHAAMAKALAAEKHSSHYARMGFASGIEITCVHRQGGRPEWLVDSIPARPDRAWLESVCRLAECAFTNPSKQAMWIGVGRNDGHGELSFVPQPPIAELRHVVMTDTAQVEANYDEPKVFWKQWRTVHKRGTSRLCVRATRSADAGDFLGEVFESTMEMVRAAKPNKTTYGEMKKWPPNLRAFWQLGPSSEELAGLPALKLVGYDASTKTLEYAGVLEKAGDEKRHVLVKEIGDINVITLAKKDAEGRPVDTVRVVFVEEWMARQERRPLRDVEARVYFMKQGKLVEVVD